MKIRFIISLAAVTGLSLISAIVSAALAAKRDYSNVFPLTDGFLNPSTAQLQNIENRAFGTLLNAPPLGTISMDGFTNLKLIALNELFEVVFFIELVTNLTNKVSGYDLSYGYNYVLQTLKAVLTVSPPSNSQKYSFTNI